MQGGPEGFILVSKAALKGSSDCSQREQDMKFSIPQAVLLFC